MVTGAIIVGGVTAPAGATGSVTTPPSPYTSGHAITVSGSGFANRATGASIQILMCEDPGGTTANLPHTNSACDGTTLNPNTIYPTATGSFTSQYTVQKLTPTTGFSITCDATHYCVLWVGEDYVNRFVGTAASPVGFSAPFLIGHGGSTTGSSSSGTVTVVIVVLVVLGVGAVGYVVWRRRGAAPVRR